MTTRAIATVGAVMLAVGVMPGWAYASIGGAYLLAEAPGWRYSRACLKHVQYIRDFERTRRFWVIQSDSRCR